MVGEVSVRFRVGVILLRLMLNNEEVGEEVGGGSEVWKSRSVYGSEVKVEGEGVSVGVGMDVEGFGG